MLRFAKPYLPLLGFALLCAIAFSGGRFGRAYLMKPLLDDVLMPTQAAELAPPSWLPGIGEAPLPQDATPASAEAGVAGDLSPEDAARELIRASFRQVLLIAGAILLVMPLALVGRAYATQYVLGRVGNDIRQAITSKLLRLPLSFHHEGATGDRLTRAVVDSQMSQRSLELVFGDFMQAGVMVLVGVATMLALSWQLTLVALLSAPLIVGVLTFFGRKIFRNVQRRQEQFGEVSQRLLGILSGIKVIKAFRGEDHENRVFGRETEKLFRRGMKVVKNRVLSRGVVDLLNNGTGIGLLILGSILVLQGRWGLTVGDLAAFAAVLATTYKPLKTLSRGYTNLVEALASAERFFEILDSEEEAEDPPHSIEMEGVREGIRFDRVGFSYGREAVLSDVSLEVEAGEVVAIVGRTGSGKTTLVDLLLRFLEVDSGSIEIDGVDLRQISRTSLLDHVAVVTQEPFLFDTTIRENIRYGRPEASEEEMAAAARAAHVDEFVDQLPQGYETQVGEFGVRLSGGQRQRITIARAILRDPAILVFDEATSALDAKTERTVQEAIDALRGERTVFVIAHRLSTIRHADRIVVLERGRVTQSGPHEALADQPGLYRELLSLQSDTVEG